MSTLVTLRVPASEFVLDNVLSHHPSVEARPLRSVQMDAASMQPALWMRGDDSISIERLLRDDLSVVDSSALFSTTESDVYRVHLDPPTGSLSRLYDDEQMSVIAAHGRDSEWAFRVHTANRTSLKALTDEWNEESIEHTVERIVPTENVQNPTRFGLTGSQYQALVTAFRDGYYSVPRESDLTTVANVLGISHQATSQRLRRGHEQLVRKALVERPAPGFPF